jgi:hypothetical protein
MVNLCIKIWGYVDIVINKLEIFYSDGFILIPNCNHLTDSLPNCIYYSHFIELYYSNLKAEAFGFRKP